MALNRLKTAIGKGLQIRSGPFKAESPENPTLLSVFDFPFLCSLSLLLGERLSFLFPGLWKESGRVKGTNLSRQTIFADSRLSYKNKAFGKRRFSQKTADFRRKPQIFAETRRKLQIGVLSPWVSPLQHGPKENNPCTFGAYLVCLSR